MAYAFVAGNERWLRFDRPIAMRGVQIGVADAAGGDLDQHLARAGHRHGNQFDRQRLPKRAHHCRLHHLDHGHSPFPSMAWRMPWAGRRRFALDQPAIVPNWPAWKSA
jgi:hypothetical protein